MRIPVSQATCQQIAVRANQLATESVRSFGWSDRAIYALQPLSGEGIVGIRTSVKYLMRQEMGTKPFLMNWVAGRVIPMGCARGDGPHFRKGSHVGEPGYVNIPHVGRVWRDARWRHPGIKPRHFMRDAIKQALREAEPQIRHDMIELLSGRQTR